MTKIVRALFSYRNPNSGEEFSVLRAWPYKDPVLAELTVKYYARKTGALTAQSNIEEIADEEIKSTKTETVAEETHSAYVESQTG